MSEVHVEWQQPVEPRRGFGCGAVVLRVLAAVIVSAITGAVVGALVATSVTPRQAVPTTAAPSPVAPTALAASAPGSQTNAAAIRAVQIVRPAVVTVINTMPRQRTLGFFGFREQQPRKHDSEQEWRQSCHAEEA